ncbi:MAG: WD40 repeat domain-containing serine/threonine protein kinase [Planctomycetaceae bacterium]
MALLCPQCGESLDFIQRSESHARCPACAAQIEISDDTESTKVFPAERLEEMLSNQPGRVPPLRFHLGRFLMMQQIGQGGFGKVFRAHDTRLNRIVALKMPHNETFVSPEERAQFLREGQKAAKLEHPGIVQVYDADEVDGVPYIASRYVDGQSLGNYMAGKRLPYRECAEIISKVAVALQHAHDHQLVHRDIKPGNIMMDRKGTPLLMDFGLAIDTQRDERMTSDGRVKGTVAYMSPEQAAGENWKIDFRTDIYSLGVVLFEMLTGERPFHGVHQKIIDQIRNSEPRQLRSFNVRIPVDLQTICQKAMEKNVYKRYQTAKDFADDLQRWLNNVPIRARRIGRIGRFTRWCRRNPGATIAVSTILVIMSVATAVTYKLYRDERVANQEANRRASRLSVTRAEQFVKDDIMAAVPWLAEAYRIDRDDASREPVSRLRLESALRKCPRLERMWFHESEVLQVSLSRDLKRFASASADNLIRVWDFESGKLLKEFQNDSRISVLEMLPDGRHLVSAGNNYVVRVWNTDEGKVVSEQSVPQISGDLLVSSTGDFIATSHLDKRARLWNWRAPSADSVRILEHGGVVLAIAFSPDGTRLASGGDGDVRIWNVSTGELDLKVPLPEMITALEYSHDGRMLAIASYDQGLSKDHQRHVRILDTIASNLEGATSIVVPKPVGLLAFSPDNKLLASLTLGSKSESITLWNVSNGTQGTPWLPHERNLYDLDFRSAGDLLATACHDGYVRVWETRTGKLRGMPMLHGDAVRGVQFIDNDRLLSFGADHAIREWNIAETPLVIAPSDARLDVVAISPDDHRLLVGGSDLTPRVYELDGVEAPGIVLPRLNGSVGGVEFSRDGSCFAIGTADGVARVWDARRGKPLTPKLVHPSSVNCVRLSRQGDKLATVCLDNIARLWNVGTGQIEREFENASEVTDVAFSPSGEWLATGSHADKTLLWKLHPTGESEGNTPIALPVSSGRLQFHPEQDLLLTVSRDGALAIWEAATARPISTYPGQPGASWTAKFSPDGKRIVGYCEAGRARVCHLDTRNDIYFGSNILHADFSSDGEFVVCAATDRSVRVWHASTGEPVTPPFIQPHNLIGCYFLPDSSSIVAITERATIFRYDLVAPTGDEVLDLLHQSELATSHRVSGQRDSVAIEPEEYRSLARRHRSKIHFPQYPSP